MTLLTRILRWLLRGADHPGRMTDAWLANKRRMRQYVAWNQREASGCIETHAYRADWPGAQRSARDAMRAERRASYRARTTR